MVNEIIRLLLLLFLGSIWSFGCGVLFYYDILVLPCIIMTLLLCTLITTWLNKKVK